MDIKYLTVDRNGRIVNIDQIGRKKNKKPRRAGAGRGKGKEKHNERN